MIGFGLGSALYAPLLERTPLPMINILDSTYPSILDYNENLFLIRGDSPTYVPGCVDYASTQLDVETMSVISATGEPYSDGLTQLVQQAAEDAGRRAAGPRRVPARRHRLRQRHRRSDGRRSRTRSTWPASPR